MKRDPDLAMSRELLDLAMAIADGRSTPPADAALEAKDPKLRANLRRLATLAAVLRKHDEAAPATQHWGHLEIGEALGSGSFGRVYSAWDSVLQRAVALKLRRDDAPGMDAFAYIEEARRLARVRHPNVLAVHGADVHDGEVGLWSDLIHGETLELVLARDGPFPPARLLPLAEQIAAALAAVHAAGLVHGDVKAANVMLDESGAAILMDFGAGTDTTSGESPGIGSPLAMAPERLAGDPPRAAADCYALGVLMFRLLSAHYPVEAADLSELRAHHRGAKALNWNQLPRRVPKPLRGLLERLLSRDPERRPSATATSERLLWLRAAPQRRRRYAAVVAIIGALGLGVLAAGLGYLEARRETARVEQVKAFVVSLFDRADIFDEDNEGELTAAALLRGGADKVGVELAGQPRAQAELLVTIGGGLLRLQDMPAARDATSRAIALFESMPRPDPRLHATALSHLGIIESHLGNADRAREHYERALAVLDAANLADVDARFSARTGLARLANERGDHGLSMRMREALLRERIVVMGPRDPAVAMDNYNLATSYMRLDRYAEAEQAYRRSEAILIETLGADHTRLLLLDTGLSSALRAQGKLAEAEQRARHAVQGWQSRGMTGKPMYANALEVLAGAQRALHRTQPACRSMREAMTIAGIRRADQAWLQQGYGECLAAQGQWARAERAFAQSEAIFDEYTDDTGRIQLARANRYHAAWRARADPAARPMMEAALRAIAEAGKSDHSTWARTALLLGRLLREQDDPQAAIPILARARDHIVALGYFGAVGRANADAELALARAMSPDQDVMAARTLLDTAAAALARNDPQSPLRKEVAAARQALDP